MAKFTVHTAVHGERGTEFFAPGDDVPEWAIGKVGDHVTDAGTAEDEAPEADSDDEGDSETATDTATAPDFTAPKQTHSRRK